MGGPPGGSRWDGPTNGPPGYPPHPHGGGREPPLAVQQAMAMEGRGPGPQQPSGAQGHGVSNSGAFSQGPVRRQTQGLLGPPPDMVEPSQPRAPGPPPFPPRGPPIDLMNVPINEEEVVGFLNQHRRGSGEQGDSWGPRGGDETPEVTPPQSRDGTPGPQEEGAGLPRAQLALYQRVQGRQRDRSKSQEQDRVAAPAGGENWYSDEDEQGAAPTRDGPPPLGAPFALSSLNLPPELTNVLTAISNKSSSGPPGSPGSKRHDPRKTRQDPRKQERLDREAEEREKDQRLMDLDIGSMFGDLDLPPLAPSPPRPTEQEESLTKALGLPFKPHIINVVNEINAGISCHSPIDWNLLPIQVEKVEFPEHKYNFTAAQVEADPRLRRLPKTGMAKLKDLPLPSFPAPKADPRAGKAKSSGLGVDRRRSSEDSEGGRVYNPAKELTKARQNQQEAYSPGQEELIRGREKEQEEQDRKEQEEKEKRVQEEPYSPGGEEGYPEERVPPRDQRGSSPYNLPPREGPGGPWQEGPQDRRGGQFHRGGPPRGPPRDQRFPQQLDHYGHQNLPPRGPFDPTLIDQRGSSMGNPNRAPHMDHPSRGPPMDHPNMDHHNRGLPMDHQRGPPMDYSNREPQMDHLNRQPPMDHANRGPEMEHPDYYHPDVNQANWKTEPHQNGSRRPGQGGSPQTDYPREGRAGAEYPREGRAGADYHRDGRAGSDYHREGRAGGYGHNKKKDPRRRD